MSKVTKFGSLLVASVLVAALFVVAAVAASSAEKVTLVQLGHAGHGDQWAAFMEERIAAFEKLHPNVTIQRVVADGDTTDKFVTMVAGGTAPDLTEMTLTRVGTLAPQGHFLDLRPYVEKDPDVSLSDYPGVAVRALTWTDESLSGLPMDVYPTATMVNRSLFHKAGVPTPNEVGEGAWNWQYVVDAGQRLTLDKNGDGSPDQWGVDTAWALISYQIPIHQAGGNLWDRGIDPTKANVTDEHTLRGLEWVADLYRRGIVAPGRFSEGQSGLNFTSSLNSLLKLQEDMDLESALPAQGPENNGSYVAVNSIQITKYSKHPELAWEWLKFISANRESMEKFVNVTGRIAAYLPVLSNFSEITGASPDTIAPYVAVVNNPESYHPGLGPSVRDAMSLVRSTFDQKVLEEGADVRTSMESIVPQINAFLSQGREKE